MDESSRREPSRVEIAAYRMEVDDLQDSIEAAEKAEVRQLVTTMMGQFPIMAAVMLGIATGASTGLLALAVCLPLEVLLFRRLGKAGEEVARIGKLLAAHSEDFPGTDDAASPNLS